MKNYIRPLLVAVTAFATINSAYSQAMDWTLFPSKQLNCNSGTTSPSSANPAGYTYNQAVNSCYDENGNFLFSTNSDGIYNASGTQIYAYNSPNPSVAPWASSPDAPIEGSAVSEIEIIQKPHSCHVYYILLWVKNNTSSSVNAADLRLIIWNNSIIGDFLLQQSVGNWWGIVADKIAANGDRNVYTLDNYYWVDPGGHIFYPINFRKWTFHADGTCTPAIATSFPPAAPPTPVHTYTPLEWMSPYSHIVEMNKSGDIGFILPYTASTDQLYTYNVNTGTEWSYHPEYKSINGFEYVPSMNVWYISYWDQSGAGAHGIGFLNNYSTTFTPVTSTTVDMRDFMVTDLELAANGKLYLAGQPAHTYDCFSSSGTFLPGRLAYINTVGLTTTAAATTPPTYLPGPVLVNGIIDLGGAPDPDKYYLQNQIDFENYAAYYKPTSVSGGYTLDNGTPVPFPSSPGACNVPPPVQNVCSGSMEIEFSPALGVYEEIGNIWWNEVDQCGVAVPGGLYGHTKRPIIGRTSASKFDTSVFTSLDSPKARDKYFHITFDVYNMCNYSMPPPDWSGSAFIHIIPPSTPVSWTVKSSAGGTTTYVSPTTCTSSSIPYVCGHDPQINFNVYELQTYWLKIRDYGTNCTGTPVLLGDGTTNPTTITGSPSSINVDLPTYLSTYCSWSTSSLASTYSTPSAYFTAQSNHIYSVELWTSNGCGNSSLGEEFFVGSLACKLSGEETATGVPTLTVAPNPADNYLNIQFSNLDKSNVVGNLYDMQGQKVLELVNINNASGLKTLKISTEDLASGIYFYKISINGKELMGKVTISH